MSFPCYTVVQGRIMDSGGYLTVGMSDTMNSRQDWWNCLNAAQSQAAIDGLVPVKDYDPCGKAPEEAIMIEKAREYGANAVFFEAGRNGRPQVAQAFIFVSDGPEDAAEFGKTHQQLWSWGGVPLLYRKTRGALQLFRCAHKPDFVSKTGDLVCNPVETLNLAAAIAGDPWWDVTQLRNGALWDDATTCKNLLAADKAAHKGLIRAVKDLSDTLNAEALLPKHLRRKLLILSLLIAYLEQREVFEEGFFGQFQSGAEKFFEVLSHGPGLVSLLRALEGRFNGNVFSFADADLDRLSNSDRQLQRFSRLVEGREDIGGQLTLWELYSFRDLPVELISHIYQLFVKNSDSSVYTPPYLVRLMLDEALSWDRLDRIHKNDEVILDPACGSGVFLVEAYKRLVLHWRMRHDWKRPTVDDLKSLLRKVHGIDIEEAAVELAAFSLCLALCDALKPEQIRASVKLFPRLAGESLHAGCFFAAKEEGVVTKPVGALLGNPPFESALTTPGAEDAYKRYCKNYGTLPDRQLAYIFLHEAMEMVAPGGVLSMLQQYNFLYNQKSLDFRRRFFAVWDVREILDFISVRGLFQKGGADTKILVVVAEASPPPERRDILHATFRRTGRADAEQEFDIDYYDLHWIPRQIALSNDGIWRCNLVGGGRALDLLERLRSVRTLGQYASAQEGWDFGEGFIEGKTGDRRTAKHITGKSYLPSLALTKQGLDETKITVAKGKLFKSYYTAARFTPPMVLIREQMDLPHDLWTKHYLTYSQQIVGFCAPDHDLAKLNQIDQWLEKSNHVLKAYLALSSPRVFIQKATALQADDIYSLPYPESGQLDLSKNEKILVDDIVDYYRDMVRLGDDSQAMKRAADTTLPKFNDTFTRQINTVYKKKPLIALEPQCWAGMICQPYCFGNGKVDWNGAAELQEKLDRLLREKHGTSVTISRICRLYEGSFVFLIKPDRLRYWLRSVALRDSDEMLADLRLQGF